MGQASIQRVHEPQWSVGGVRGGGKEARTLVWRGKVVTMVPSKRYEPRFGWMRRVCLPTHPRPAREAYSRSSKGAVSVVHLKSWLG